uniref:Uncharacterized protein n=1 Tax=Arundo donax TaxID=35708 RepID=A0A0A9GIM1_ARUDO
MARRSQVGTRSEARPARRPNALPTSLATERPLSCSWVRPMSVLMESE